MQLSVHFSSHQSYFYTLWILIPLCFVAVSKPQWNDSQGSAERDNCKRVCWIQISKALFGSIPILNTRIYVPFCEWSRQTYSNYNILWLIYTSESTNTILREKGQVWLLFVYFIKTNIFFIILLLKLLSKNCYLIACSRQLI